MLTEACHRMLESAELLRLWSFSWKGLLYVRHVARTKAPTKSDCSESDGEEGNLHPYDKGEALLLGQIGSPPHVSSPSLKLQHALWFASGQERTTSEVDMEEYQVPTQPGTID